MRFVTVIIAAALCVTLACGRSSSLSESAPDVSANSGASSAAVPAMPVPTNLSTTRSYHDGEIVFGPPLGSPTAAFSAAQAYSLCGGSPRCRFENGSPSVELALFSYHIGAPPPPGDRNLDYSNVLVWLMTWRKARCTFRGGQGSLPTQPTITALCDYFTTVDATTGLPLIAYEEGAH